MGREMQRDNVGLDVNQSWCSNGVGVLRCRKSTEAPGWRIAVVVPIGWLNQAASIKPLAEADWHISINCGHRIWVLMEQQLPHRKKTS